MIKGGLCLKSLRGRRGMTLLEILLAMLILGMVVSMVSMALSGSVAVVDATRNQGELYYRAQVALQRISADLASALLVEGVDFIGDDEQLDGRGADSLEFTSTAHLVFDPGNDHPGIAFISYLVKADEENEGELLLLRSDDLFLSPEIAKTAKQDREGFVLCDRLRSVNFTYIDENGEEHDSWTSFVDPAVNPAPPRKLPVAVLCTLEFWLDREKETTLEFTTKVLLPAGLINAES